MKKIVLLSLMTLSSGLLGNVDPNNQQPTDQTPRPTQHHTAQGYRSPQEQAAQTPVHITQSAGRQLNQMYQRRLNRAEAETAREEAIANRAIHPPRNTNVITTARRQAEAVQRLEDQPAAATQRQAHPRNLNLNTQSRVNDDDTPGAPRARDEDETNS